MNLISRMGMSNEVNENLLESLMATERQERLAVASRNSEIISKLNLSNLPQKCQELLREAAAAQIASEMDNSDLTAISLAQTRETADTLDEDYQILKLKQKNKELQMKIDRNAAVMERLKRDLAQSKQSLALQTPSPDTIQDYCQEMAQKVASYEESCRRAEAKLSALAVPEPALPGRLAAAAAALAALGREARDLGRRAEEVALVQQARHALAKLKK